jgi:hypothetical protein
MRTRNAGGVPAAKGFRDYVSGKRCRASETTSLVSEMSAYIVTSNISNGLYKRLLIYRFSTKNRCPTYVVDIELSP